MMDVKQNTKKYLILTFIVMSLFIFFKIDFRLKEIIPGAISDDSAYYYHSQTIGVDLDLDYSNQLEGTNKRNLNIENDNPVPVHPIGVGILSGPILFISNNINQILNLDSIVSFNYFIYSFTAIIYIYIGLNLINKILKDKIRNYNPLKTYLLLLGSGLTYFAFERFSMSHAYEFFSISLLFYLSFLYSKNPRMILQLFIPLAMFTLLTIRWSNYHIFLIPLIFNQLFDPNKKLDLYLKIRFIVGSLIGSTLFLLHTKFLYGIYTFNPSNIFLLVENRLSSNYEQLLDISRIPENILLTLRTLLTMIFTQEFGLFYFSPIVFASFIFLLILIYKKRFKLFFLLGVTYLIPFLPVLVFQNTSYSYGFRYMYSLIAINLLVYFRYFSNYKLLNYYLFIFSFFSIFSQLMFETSQFTVLSTEYVVNSFGEETLYANPNYLTGVFKSSLLLDSYLNIVFTSFLGILILKVIGSFTNTFEFVGRFKDITEDIELLLNNSINISWFYLIVLFFILFFIVKSLSKNISKNHFKQLLS